MVLNSRLMWEPFDRKYIKPSCARLAWIRLLFIIIFFICSLTGPILIHESADSGQRSQYVEQATGWRTQARITAWTRSLALIKTPRAALGPTSLLFNGHLGQSNRDMKMTTNLHLVPRLNVSGVLPPFPLYAFMAGMNRLHISLPPPPSFFFFFFFCGSLSRRINVFPTCSPPGIPILRYLSPINNSHLSRVILYIILPSILGSPLRSFMGTPLTRLLCIYLNLFNDVISNCDCIGWSDRMRVCNEQVTMWK
jgi:hypothetical protein